MNTAAPFLLLSSLDPVQEVLAVRSRISLPAVRRLGEILTTINVPLTLLDHEIVPHDLWIQDAVEIGVRIEGDIQRPAALAGLRAGSESVNAGPLDQAVREFLATQRGVEIINAGAPRAQTRWIDWYGNLEVSPPVPGFPWGRALTGKQHDLTLHPDVLAFLSTQNVQTPPVFLDVSFLTIGHVDEVVNFVPANRGKGFCALMPSVAAARQILEKLIQEKADDRLVFAGTASETTVRRLWNEIALSSENTAAEQALLQIRAQLCDHLHLSARDFICVPALFEQGMAVIPSLVNSLVVGTHLIAPDPRGPRRENGGADEFVLPLRRQLEEIGCRLHLIDVFDSYHARGGEIHCGTNALRKKAPLLSEAGPSG